MSYLACHSHCAVNGVMVYGIPYIAKFVCVLYGNIGEAYCQTGTFEEVIDSLSKIFPRSRFEIRFACIQYGSQVSKPAKIL